VLIDLLHRDHPGLIPRQSVEQVWPRWRNRFSFDRTTAPNEKNQGGDGIDIFDKSRLGNNNGSESRRFVARKRITRAQQLIRAGVRKNGACLYSCRARVSIALSCALWARSSIRLT
jgi:hypothetical protein